MIIYYKESKKEKYEASSLKELFQKFGEYKDEIMLVWPYLPRVPIKGESEFGLIIEGEHVVYEVGLSRNLFDDPYYFLSRKIQQRIPEIPISFDPIRRMIDIMKRFSWCVTLYLRDKGYIAIPVEVQTHLDRNPKRTILDDEEDLKIFYRLLTEAN
jgi:hypothetical protein